MLSRAKNLLAVATHHRMLFREASLARFSNSSRNIAEANQELDDFFGVPYIGCVANSTPSTSTANPTASPNPSGFPTTAAEASRNSTCGTTAHAAAAAAPPTSFAGNGNGVKAAAPWFSSDNSSSTGSNLQHKQLGVGVGQPEEEQQQQPRRLTHVDASGSATMVDVSQKAVTVREAQASCTVSLGAAFDLVASNTVAKGDVLKVAQLAGIAGAKATASLIPLCHNIPISKVDVQLALDPPSRCLLVRALARTDGKTGVEMEALTAASVAALTVYDMCKGAARDLVVGPLQLDYKSGGRSGTYLRAGLRRADLLPSARPPL